jgi:hypothetical protein
VPPLDEIPKVDCYGYELAEGEILEGRALRLPRPNTTCGSFLFLDVNGDVFVIKANAHHGRVVLERELIKAKVGDQIRVAYFGKRTTLDRERSYHHFTVTVT